jgi:hypothetical protein
MSLTAFRPRSTLTIDFLLDCIKILLRERGKPIIMPRTLSMWKKDRVVWTYLADGSIRFDLENVARENRK